jgi:transcriptional accessory protein Tex/SPT6
LLYNFQTWNEQRTEALGLALNKMLYPLFEQELIQKLKEEATNHYLQVIMMKSGLAIIKILDVPK